MIKNLSTLILLVNVGTPRDTSVKSVRKYLSEFLNDKRVIDLPFLLRKFLVNCIIVPFRAKKSANMYRQIWTDKGSPLLTNGMSLKEKLQSKFFDAVVELAMNYQQPSIEKVLQKYLSQNIKRIIVFPMFPHYASSTTGSSVEKILRILQSQNKIPSLKIISPYFDNQFYISTLAESVKKYDIDAYDHILISFHGLPLRQINKTHVGKTCEDLNCKSEMNETNQFCYHAQCYETSRLLAQALNLSDEKYSVSFQSRLTKNWLSPFTDETILRLAKKRMKKLLVVCPSFTADCLETLYEISIEYKNLFIEAGGEELQLVESLNDHDVWVDATFSIINC